MTIIGSSIQDVNNLKSQLSEHFVIKDLGEAKQIHGIRISRDREIGKLKLSQEEYMNRVFSRFSMQEAKLVGSPLASHKGTMSTNR